MPFHIVPLLPKATAGKAAKADFGERSRARKVGGEWQIVATVQLEALKAIAVFEASVQPHDTSPSREYVLSSMLERNRTKRNGKRRFLRIVRAVAVSFLWLFV